MDTKGDCVNNAHVQVIGILWSNCSIVSTPHITSLGGRLFYMQSTITMSIAKRLSLTITAVATAD